VPHIKVNTFDTQRLDGLILSEPHFLFRAEALRGEDEMLAVVYEEIPFLLEIKKRKEGYLIKPDLISRPLDVSKIKRVLQILVSALSLEVQYSNLALSPHKPDLAEAYNKKIRDFENPSFSREKVAIEVGFGSGRHLLYQAQKRPDTLFIGIEIHTPSAEQVLKQIALQGLDNVWVVNYDARLLLEMMPSNSCSDIYVHFPVPWDKKPHRRVISEGFLRESLRALVPEGKLELRTDSDRYYQHALETFSLPPHIEFKVEKNRDLPISSKYEDRWRAQEKDIYTLTVYARELSEEKKRAYDFSFAQKKGTPDFVKVSEETVVKEGYFVHFERKYRICGSDDMMLRCAFGSFDKPEHKYLIQQGDGVHYYPQDPVKTEVNYLAHQQIGAMIYG